MSKSLIIDFKLLEELKIEVNHLLFMYDLYVDQLVFNIIIDNDLQYLEQKRLIKVHKDKVILRQGAKELIELLLVNNSSIIEDNGKKIIKKSDRKINSDIDNRIQEFRNLWRGLKPGSMGSLQSCKVKMARWMFENPEHSFDAIINAAKLYLRTEGLNTRFLQRADYFIYKQENNREESSRLSAYIDDVDIVDDNWTNELI